MRVFFLLLAPTYTSYENSPRIGIECTCTGTARQADGPTTTITGISIGNAQFFTASFPCSKYERDDVDPRLKRGHNSNLLLLPALAKTKKFVFLVQSIFGHAAAASLNQTNESFAKDSRLERVASSLMDQSCRVGFLVVTLKVIFKLCTNTT